MLLRRTVLALGFAGGLALAGLLVSCTTTPAAGPAAPAPAQQQAPILFVHGNGDSAALWTTTLWRFESNGWPRERMSAVDLVYPTARNEDDKAQPGRTSLAEFTALVAAEVARVRRETGAPKVVLVGLSRGGYPIRSFIADGGAAQVSHAILGGVPNHGVWNDPAFLPGNEFNGAGPALTRLNTPQGPDGLEVAPGIRWMTIRSDNNDKFAQPDGVWVGRRGQPTHVSYDGPALRGAENVVIAGVDHREAAFSAQAFEQTWRFLTGSAPAATAVAPESPVVLDGKVSGLGLNNRDGAYPTNLPLVGATLEVYATDPANGERRGGAVHRKTIGVDGLWGPFRAEPDVPYEFVIAAPGYATTHVYRSPFPRASRVVNLRAERLLDADRDAAAVVVLTRPRGYFGLPRDRIALDGKPPPGVPPGTAGISSARLKVAEPGRSVVGEFNGERIAGRAWPVASNELTFLELHY